MFTPLPSREGATRKVRSVTDKKKLYFACTFKCSVNKFVTPLELNQCFLLSMLYIPLGCEGLQSTKMYDSSSASIVTRVTLSIGNVEICVRLKSIYCHKEHLL